MDRSLGEAAKAVIGQRPDIVESSAKNHKLRVWAHYQLLLGIDPNGYIKSVYGKLQTEIAKIRAVTIGSAPSERGLVYTK